jgi:hypothetical protein
MYHMSSSYAINLKSQFPKEMERICTHFHCTRGVRQGDLLAPLLFCLAEEVLSRVITKLVEEGKLKLILGSRSVKVPSHTLYANDIMVFCKGNLSGLQSLKVLFTHYANKAGQLINPAKSTIYHGSLSQAKIGHIVLLLGFNIGSFPFMYLGVPVFKGKPNRIHLQGISDTVKVKLIAWKASHLFMAGRV